MVFTTRLQRDKSSQQMNHKRKKTIEIVCLGYQGHLDHQDYLEKKGELVDQENQGKLENLEKLGYLD